MDNSYNEQGFDPYYARLMEARRLEKKALTLNCTKLGALLLIYNLLNYLLKYVYFIAVASAHSGRAILLPSDAISYLREHEALIASSAFSMGGNLTVVFVSVVLILFIARFMMNVRFEELLHPRAEHIPQALKWLPMCMVLNIAMSILVTLLQNYLSAFGVTVPESDFTITRPSTAAIVLQFTYVIVVGPLAEELIYRGLILTLLRPFGKWLSVFFSALIFGIMHGNIPQAASAFASAMVLGIIALECGSIIPTIIIHVLNNLMASYNDFADVLKWPYASEIYMALQIVLIFAGVFVMMGFGSRLVRPGEERYAMTSGQRCQTVFLNIFMLIYFGYALIVIAQGFISAN